MHTETYRDRDYKTSHTVKIVMLSLLYAICFWCFSHSWSESCGPIDGRGGRVSTLCGCQSDQAGRTCGTVNLLFCSDEQNWNFAVQGTKGNSFDDQMAREADSWLVVRTDLVFFFIVQWFLVGLCFPAFVPRWSWCYSTKEWTEKEDDAASDYGSLKRVSWRIDGWTSISSKVHRFNV